MLKSTIVLAATITGGIILAVISMLFFNIIIEERDRAVLLGVGIGISSMCIVFFYSTLYMVQLPPKLRHRGIGPQKGSAHSSGLALSFLLIGGAVAKIDSGSDLVAAFGAIIWAGVGALVGADLQKREGALTELKLDE